MSEKIYNKAGDVIGTKVISNGFIEIYDKDGKLRVRMKE